MPDVLCSFRIQSRSVRLFQADSSTCEYFTLYTNVFAAWRFGRVPGSLSRVVVLGRAFLKYTRCL